MQHELVFNGIDGATGDYLHAPLTEEHTKDDDIEEIIIGEKIDKTHLKDVKDKKRRLKEKKLEKENISEHLGTTAEVEDLRKLEQTGWGVIFAYDPEARGANPLIKDALSKLLEHRKEQATKKCERRYQEYVYQHEDTAYDFLRNNGATIGPADPDNMPYYLLIVGHPEEIPYSFQYQLDVQYAVGRIYFRTLAEYAQYALSVVTAEKDRPSSQPRTAFFSTLHPQDRATKLSTEHLVNPLETWVRRWMDKQKPSAWLTTSFLTEKATKANLANLLGGKETPALLFTASHGLSYREESDEAVLNRNCGALICQDWPGPGSRKAPSEDHFFAATDVSEQAQLLGLIVFCFACCGAGLPKQNSFKPYRSMLFSQARIAALPQRLLSHPKGGALAFIGHVDLALGHSFYWDGNSETNEISVFESTMQKLLDGYPVGAAMEYFNSRYSDLTTTLNSMREAIKEDRVFEPSKLWKIWQANNDARGYVVIGDPAVRLRTGGGNKRLTISPVQLSSYLQQAPGLFLQKQSSIPTDEGDRELGKLNLDQAEDQLLAALKEFLQSYNATEKQLSQERYQEIADAINMAGHLERLLNSIKSRKKGK